MVFVLAFPCFICDIFSTGSEILMQDKGNLMFLTENTEIFTEMASRLAGKALGFTQIQPQLKLFKYKFTLSLCRLQSKVNEGI